MSEVNEIQTLWVTPLVTVVPEPVDHDLHAFHVYRNGGAHFLGSIRPDGLDTQENIVVELNAGCCPVADGWEDGNGNTCTIEGWRGAELSFATDLELDIMSEIVKPDPRADAFFLEDRPLMHDMLGPAYESLEEDDVDTDDDGFLGEATIDYHLITSQDPNKSNVGKQGHARCLVPFLGWCMVKISRTVTLNEVTTKHVRDLVDQLKYEGLTRSARQFHSIVLLKVLDGALFPEERYTDGPPRESISIEPINETLKKYVVDYNDGTRYTFVGMHQEVLSFAESLMKNTHKDIDIYADDALVSKARWYDHVPHGIDENEILFQSEEVGIYTEWEFKN